jgi:hypothetical protein
MLFEKYGSVPEIIRNLVMLIKGRKNEDWAHNSTDPTR